MKQSNTCPKCKSTDVVRIPAFKNTSTANYIQLTKWGTAFTFFNRYICNSCGFMEHYVDIDDNNWRKWYDKQCEENKLDSDFV